MIFGVDHIALSCGDISHGVKLLNEIGYRAKYVQEDIPNNPAKRPFLKSYDSAHSIAYCQIANGVSIELTQHASTLNDTVSSYQLLFNRPPADTIDFDEALPLSWENAWRAVPGCRHPVAALWVPFHSQFWYDAEHDNILSGFVSALMLSVKNLHASERFWTKGLSFSIINRGITDDGHEFLHIAFRPPVKAWSLDLILLEDDKRKSQSYLDDSGFPCLALISNHLADDKERLLDTGAGDLSDEFSLNLGNKSLNILMLRGPDSEIIEIIELVK